jgi:predicted Rossmann fold flavoprotein
METYDAVVVGAGAAGLFCAGVAGQRGLRVLLLDHAPKVAEKIRISGGGRCNFTNREVTPAQFVSANPHYCRSALARYGAGDFIDLVKRHGIAHHEKHKGQLFCDRSADDIIEMLLSECAAGGVTHRQPCAVQAVRRGADGYELDTDAGPVRTPQLVIATGGLPVPKIGASDWGLQLARRHGHRVVDTRPALVPLTFPAEHWAPFVPLAGVALPVHISTGTGRQRTTFSEDLLFTHRGLSGPAVLQISSFWQGGTPLQIDLTAGADPAERLLALKQTSRRQLGNELAQQVPARLAETWLAQGDLPSQRPMADCRDRDLQALAQRLSAWQITPGGTEGWNKAEVMAGGVDTRDLSSQTMESRVCPGLYFIGEVVDVTGWLGGYNFQWAWSSGHACAQALSASH